MAVLVVVLPELSFDLPSGLVPPDLAGGVPLGFVSPDLAGGVPLGFVLLELPPDLLDGICDLDVLPESVEDVLPDDPDCAGGCPSDVPEVSVSTLAAVPIVAVIWLELMDLILPYMVELL